MRAEGRLTRPVEKGWSYRVTEIADLLERLERDNSEPTVAEMGKSDRQGAETRIEQRKKLASNDYLKTLDQLRLWRMSDACDFARWPQELRAQVDRKATREFSEYHELRDAEIEAASEGG